jgi:hypothetical protein
VHLLQAGEVIWQVPKTEGVHPSDQITIAFTYGGATARAGCVFIVPVDVTVTIRDAGIDRTDVGNLTSYDESHDQVDLDFQSDRLFISATLRRMETGVAISGSVHLIDDQSETYASFNRAAGP